MVLDILSGFKGITPFKGITLDDGWDQINRSFMFVLCVVMGTVVTVRQYAGGIISCDGFTKFSGSFSEDYCWTQGLYTIKEAYDHLPENMPYPGVIPEDIPACFERELVNGGKVTCPDPELVKKTNKSVPSMVPVGAILLLVSGCSVLYSVSCFQALWSG
jgi:hypothetical protein